MSIKVACTKIHLNHSNSLPEYFGYIRSNHDPTMLVSPLAVAGIVIGLVLFLSCITIIIGSLRKDQRDVDWRLAHPSYDGISYSASFGDLSPVCTGDASLALEIGSYLELSASYMDFPPCYNDCVGPGASEIFLPVDNPPPYSLEDPHCRSDLCLGIRTEGITPTTQDNIEQLPPLATVDLHIIPQNQAVTKMSLHIPVKPLDQLKDISTPTIVVSQGNV